MYYTNQPPAHLRAATRTALGAITLLAAVCAGMVPAAAQTAVPAFVAATEAAAATASAAAEQGIPVGELAPNAPDHYVVKRGDTLWGIAGVYLRRPWAWPQLWGMNKEAIANPHLIYPGQTLYLDRQDGFARLRTGSAKSAPGELETVRLSPRTRSESVSDLALPTLKSHLIEPFLVEPLVVEAAVLEQAARIIATADERVLMTTGDRA